MTSFLPVSSDRKSRYDCVTKRALDSNSLSGKFNKRVKLDEESGSSAPSTKTQKAAQPVWPSSQEKQGLLLAAALRLGKPKLAATYIERGAPAIIAIEGAAQPWREALKGDYPEILLQMFKGGMLKQLDRAGRKEIFQWARDRKVNDVALELLKLGLDNQKRQEALEWGMSADHLPLVKAAMTGANGQSLLRSTTEFSFTFFRSLKGQEVDSSIVDYLIEVVGIKKDELQETEWIKLLAHFWEIDGDAEVGGQRVPFAGGYPAYYFSPSTIVLKKFSDLFPGIMSSDLCQFLTDLIKSSSYKVSVEEKLERYQAGQPLLLHTGSEDHSVAVVLWGTTMLICDRAGVIKNPVQAFVINPALVTSDIIIDILNSDDRSSADLVSYFKELCVSLEAEERLLLTQFFSDEWPGQREQLASNCSWSSFITSLMAVAGLYRRQYREKVGEFFPRAQQRAEVKLGMQTLFVWSNYLRVVFLRSYLAAHKKSKKPVCTKLVKAIMPKIAADKENCKVAAIAEQLALLQKECRDLFAAPQQHAKKPPQRMSVTTARLSSFR